MMRVLLGVVLAAAALWAGYWFVGAQAVTRAADAGFQQATVRGLLAQNDGLRVAGFPNRFDLTMTAPQVFDPASGYGWQGADLRLLAMTWKPWHLIALAPDASVITTPMGAFDLTADDLRGSVVLHPGTDLALRSTVIEATGLAVDGPLGRVGVARATFATTEDTSRLNSHRIGAQITDLTPDPAMSAAVPDLPAVITGLRLDAYLLLTAPLNRHAGDTPPQLTGVILDEALLDWGPLQVTAKGAVAAVADGSAEGRIDVTIQNWRLLPGVLGQAGLIDPVLAPTLLRMFEVMAEGSPNLATALIFKSGRSSFGPLPLGPAPRLAYRQ